MARRSGKALKSQQISDGLIPTAVLLLCFLAAGVAGCLAAASVEAGSAASLSEYLQNYLALLAEGETVSPSIWAVAWELGRWPLLVFLLGFTALGAVAIPAAFCVRGFLLAYAIASFVRVFGNVGLVMALAVFGMTALISVPALFGLGSVMFPSSLRLAVGVFGDRPAGPKLRERFAGLAPCGALIVLAVFFQWAVMPQLLRAVSGMLPIT